MKKKFLLMLLALVSALCLAFGLTACGKTKDNDGPDTPEHTHNYDAWDYNTPIALLGSTMTTLLVLRTARRRSVAILATRRARPASKRAQSSGTTCTKCRRARRPVRRTASSIIGIATVAGWIFKTRTERRISKTSLRSRNSGMKCEKYRGEK